MGWFVYDLTRSALALGFVGLASFAPAMLGALVTGHVADTYDRRRSRLWPTGSWRWPAWA